MLGKALLVCLRVYLDCFALFAPNFAHAKFEHSLIEASFRERIRDLRRDGAGAAGAAARAFRAHAAEIEPVALCRKTVADARTAPRLPGETSRYILRVGTIATVVLTVLFLTVRGLVADGGGAVTTARASESDAGAVGTIGEYDSLREAIYHTTGVCISPSVTAEDLNDELLSHGSPGADCTDLGESAGGLEESRADP